MSTANQQPITKNKLLIHKTIYQKRKGTFNKEMFQKVLINEIKHHISQHPDVAFLKLGDQTKNSDGSITYPIIFTERE